MHKRLLCLVLAVVVILWGSPFALAQQIQVKVVALTSPVKPGAVARLVVQTSPRAQCTLVLQYKSGIAKVSGLGKKIADGKGALQWSWKVGAGTTGGSWPLTITCTRKDQKGVVLTSLVVR